MLVVLISESNNTYATGINATYSSCSVLTSSQDKISSTNYPNNYANFESICWVISPPDDYVVNLSFNFFDTLLKFDYVQVFDGNSTFSPVLLSASGNTIPDDVTSSSNIMLIVFSSSAASVRQGFEAVFYSALAG